MRPVITLLLILIFSALLPAQTIWYVRANASPGSADGASWATAILYLEDALEAAAPGDIIVVAEGAYKPTTNNDRTASFQLKDGVRLYGGFAGTETELSQRDWVAHPTILSGDIGTPGLASDNSYAILYAAQTGMDTRVDGFVFEGGQANHPDNVNVLFFEKGHSGSAIYLNGQNPGNFAYLSIENCTFRNNSSDYFGAVYANGRNSGKCAVQVDRCRFEANTCGGAGGGLAVDNDGAQLQPTLIYRSVFERNFAFNRGGGLLLGHHGDVWIEDCSFMRDSARFHAGGAVAIEGDFIHAQYRFDNCLFDQNRVGTGAAGAALLIEQIYSDAQLTFQRCTFSRHTGPDLIYNPSVFGKAKLNYRNCIFRENAVTNLFYQQTIGVAGEQRFVNCLFYKTGGAEIYGNFDDDNEIVYRLQNCIIVRDPATKITSGNPQIILENCLVSNADCPALGTGVTCGPGMLFGANPLFVNAAAGDFHLQACSPAINAGDNTAIATPVLDTDLDGRNRVLNGTVDLGPYEHQLFPAALIPSTCPDSYDGAISVGDFFCPPLLFSWSKDGETGTRTDSLAAGTYLFSFQDAAGHAQTDTLEIPSLPPMAIVPNVAGVSCFGLSDGVAGISVSGGTPPYEVHWFNGNTSGYLFGMPGGSYPVTVTDAKGCAASEVIHVNDPGLIQVLYTVVPASAPGKADGQIRIDTILHGTSPYVWQTPGLNNLLPGTYQITVTDANGCVVVVPVIVGVAIGVDEAPKDVLSVTLSPNPVQASEIAWLRWEENAAVETVLLQDATGKVLLQLRAPAGAVRIALPAPEAAGAYWLTVLGEKQGRVLRWVVLRH